MAHGITASTSLQVSRRAAFEKKLSDQSIQKVNEMIENYKRELEEYRLRLLKLENTEIQRLAKESALKEELFNNHGKPLSYFKVP